MIDNSSYIFKGIMLTLCGALITFFPGVIAWIFYIIGAVIIVGSAFTFFGSLGEGEGGSMFFGCLVGAAIGFGVMALPRFVTVQIPLIAGIVFTIVGVMRLIKTYGKKYNGNKAVCTASGILLLLAGIFFMLNPFKVSKIVRIILGIFMIGSGIFDFVVAHFITERNNNSQPSVIDVDVNSVSDSSDE